MKIAVRMARQDEAEAILLKLAGASAVAHVVALAAFSILPRLTQPPTMPRAIVAEIVPASALSLPAPAQAQAPAPRPSGPTPTQRAEAARRAQKPTPDPTTPPLEARPKTKAKRPEPVKPEPVKPAPEPEKPEPEPSAEDAPSEPAQEPKPSESAHGITFGGATGPGGIPSIGSSGFPYDYYRSSLVSILQSNWRRPVAPEGLTKTLTARVQFTILKSGIVQDPRLVERSGNDALDQSALRAVYDSNPLPPLPFQYGHASVNAEVVFELTSD